VLVCLIILTLVSGAILKVSMAHRELAREREHRLQAEWLAESGAERAVARLTRDGDYTGEIWNLSRTELGLSASAPAVSQPEAREEPAARITIAVTRLPAAPHRRGVSIKADYPLVEARRARHSKEFMIDLEPSQKGTAP
jgi:hypothetical protein